jgi:hypothetical protein
MDMGHISSRGESCWKILPNSCSRCQKAGSLQVDAAVKDLEKPGLGQFAWVLWSHTTLSVIAPVYGAIAETFCRMMLLALCIYEAVGLLSPGSAKKAKDGLDSKLQLEKVMLDHYS